MDYCSGGVIGNERGGMHRPSFGLIVVTTMFAMFATFMAFMAFMAFTVVPSAPAA